MSKKEKNLTIIISLIVIGALVVISPLLYFFGEIFIEMVFDKPSKPTITHGEFPFELVYYEQDLSNVVGAKIVSWNPSETIQNTFK